MKMRRSDALMHGAVVENVGKAVGAANPQGFGRQVGKQGFGFSRIEIKLASQLFGVLLWGRRSRSIDTVPSFGFGL